ncbi:hypothetical protein TcWFU_008836 [Taenia crassiceps]|uniref:Uncharacterized protein n=1 Tax=Taenia crassiceps TaxID=6207 RepID=A0ABR4QFN2_9CEST
MLLECLRLVIQLPLRLPSPLHPTSRTSTFSTHLMILMGEEDTRTPIPNPAPHSSHFCRLHPTALEGSYNAARADMAAGDGSPQRDIKVQAPVSHSSRSENTTTVPYAVVGINLKDIP